MANTLCAYTHINVQSAHVLAGYAQTPKSGYPYFGCVNITMHRCMLKWGTHPEQGLSSPAQDLCASSCHMRIFLMGTGHTCSGPAQNRVPHFSMCVRKHVIRNPDHGSQPLQNIAQFKPVLMDLGSKQGTRIRGIRTQAVHRLGLPGPRSWVPGAK